MGSTVSPDPRRDYSSCPATHSRFGPQPCTGPYTFLRRHVQNLPSKWLFVRRNKRAPLIFFPPTSGTTFGEQACEPTPQHGAASHTQRPVTLPPSPLRGGPGPVAGVREASQRHGPRRELGGKVKTQVARAASPCCKVTALF